MKPFLCLAALLMASMTPAMAQDGTLDTSFGTGGRVETNFFSLSADEARAVAIQADGKIVAAGRIGNDFGLARYNTDGTLDASFGTVGLIKTNFPGNRVDVANAVVIQADGKIVAAGITSNRTSGVTHSDFAVARYNTDGTLDASFGTGGLVETDFPGSESDEAHAVVIQSDGKIVVAGYTSNFSSGTSHDFAVARYNADGTLDASFGTGGLVETDFGDQDQANAVAIQSDGKIVAVGRTLNSGTSYDFAVARYNTDGTLDASFGTGGLVETNFPGNITDEAHAVAIQSDGKIVAVGRTLNSGTSYDFAVARYNTDGTLDASFGTGGLVETNFPGRRADEANAVAIQADGKIVAAGYTSNSTIGTTHYDFAVARYNVTASECLDPLTAPSYAGGYVLNSTQTRAFVRVMAPQGGTAFEFYDTSNLVVAMPETDTESGTALPGVTRVGDAFTFTPASPSEVYFPITTAGAGTGVSFYLRVTDACDRTVDVDPSFAITGVETEELTGFALSQASPSPTTGQATIRFSLDSASQVRLSVYDVLGREVARLVEGMMSEGTHAARFDGSSLPSGLYLYRLTAEGQAAQRTLTIAR